jgi:uncharacterized membrane protein
MTKPVEPAGPPPASAAASPPAKELQSVLDHGDSARIAEAVRLAEVNTSSEIVVKLSAATGSENIRSIAEAEFIRLGLAALAPGNGVLIYVSLNRRAVEIVVGPAAAEKIPAILWRAAAASIAEGFRTGKPANGIITAVNSMAEPLEIHFPPTEIAGPELPDVSEDT